MAARKLPTRGFVYCRHCETVSRYEEDELFSGELFCPSCAARTLPDDRRSTEKQALSLSSRARLYRLDARPAA